MELASVAMKDGGKVAALAEMLVLLAVVLKVGETEIL